MWWLIGTTALFVLTGLAFELAMFFVPRFIARFCAGGREAGDDYRPYTTFFDKIVETRRDLDLVLGPVPANFAGELERHWQTFETGLTGYRLRLHTAALESDARLRAALSEADRDDILISLLLDQSGSMRGDRIVYTATALDIILDFLVALGIRVEILGFTTSRWKGGLSREFWIQHGRPPLPGRLNDLLHIVYRSGDDHGPSDRDIFRSMLRPDLLKENIDGEAIEWAATRLFMRPETQKILIHISDGVPCDDSSIHANTNDMLAKHAQAVISCIDAGNEMRAATICLDHEGAYCAFEEHYACPKLEEFGLILLEQIEEMLLDTSARNPSERPSPASA